MLLQIIQMQIADYFKLPNHQRILNPGFYKNIKQHNYFQRW